MTTDAEHTYSFYLLVQHRIRRDIRDNRTARRHASTTKDTNILLLDLMNKYKSDKKSPGNINRIITHSQATSIRLDSEYNTLQSEAERLNTYLNNNDDIAGRAYDAAYPDPETEPKIWHSPNSIFMRLGKFLTRRTK